MVPAPHDRAPRARDDLELALAAADLADSITLARFRAEDLLIETKPDLTPVTDADRGVERAIHGAIHDARPDDAILGEEYGARGAGRGRPAPGQEDRRRRWIVDPIDGTQSYVRGMPIFASLIALEVDGEVQLGVVSAPALAMRWWASRGRGAHGRCACGRGAPPEGRSIKVSRVSELAGAQLAWSGIEDWVEVGRLQALLALGSGCRRTRGVGDFWQYMLVAEGAAEVALDPTASIWDLAAVQVIVEEAGGRFTDLGGTRTHEGGDAIATNGLLHDAALAIVGR
ncbi:MAG: inositol monophosphatase family protein [Solirubrobacteraceae bacterium]